MAMMVFWAGTGKLLLLLQNRSFHRDRKQIGGYQELGRGRNMVLFCYDKNVLILDKEKKKEITSQMRG